ncbi:alpha/beta hydrolase, partial [Rhodobacterales bacterium HKCCE2091]|nr:alpha/beta hydrolase [Rhodobacterales bacterium HKCCE2091]
GQGAALAVRHALADGRVAALAAISLPPGVATPAEPDRLLIVNGAFEFRNRAAAAGLTAGTPEGETRTGPGDAARRAVSVRLSEHLTVLYAAATHREIRDWFNAAFGRSGSGGLALIGLPLLLTLAGLVMLAEPFARAWPAGRRVNEVPPGAFWTLALAPSVLAPVMLWLVPTNFLGLDAAGDLAAHLLFWGILVLAGLALEGDTPRLKGWRAGIGVAVYGILVLGAILDRYVWHFTVSGDRWTVFAMILPGALVAMTADATLIQSARARPWRRVAARTALIGSLALAAVFEPSRRTILFVVLPVLVFFFATFGAIAGFVGRRSGSSAAMGLGLGLCLAWTLAATLPLADAQ